MPLTADEQHELDTLEYEKLSAEKAGASLISPTAVPAGEDSRVSWARRIGVLALGPIGIPTAISGKAPPLEAMKSMALNTGGAVAGAEVGAIFAPETLGASIILGGAIGSALGNTADQATRPGQKGIKLGELAGQTLVGGIPGASLGSSGALSIAKEALKQGAGGLAAKAIQTGIDEHRLPTATEAAVAGGLPAIGGATAQKLQSADPTISKAVADAQLKSSVKRATLEEAQKIGLVAPPSLINPQVRTGVVETIAEKGPTRQAASIVNQNAVDNAVRREIGLPENSPINQQTLEAVRAEAGKAYADIASLANDENMERIVAVSRVNPEAADNILAAPQTLEALKQARADASGYYKLADRSADPAHLKLARSYEKSADELEAKIEDAARYSGEPELYQALKDARVQIAKTYTIERAMNLGDGTVSAKDLGRALDKGVPLSGDLQTVAKFALAFPRVVQDSTKVASAGISTQSAGLGAIVGGLVGASTHNPIMSVAAATVPAMASAGARQFLLSKPYQQTYARVLGDRVKADPNLVALLLRQGTQAAGQEAQVP